MSRAIASVSPRTRFDMRQERRACHKAHACEIQDARVRTSYSFPPSVMRQQCDAHDACAIAQHHRVPAGSFSQLAP